MKHFKISQSRVKRLTVPHTSDKLNTLTLTEKRSSLEERVYQVHNVYHENKNKNNLLLGIVSRVSKETRENASIHAICTLKNNAMLVCMKKRFGK